MAVLWFELVSLLVKEKKEVDRYIISYLPGIMGGETYIPKQINLESK